MSAGGRGIAIVLGEDRLSLSGPAASALSDHLWKGLTPGAVTAALLLSRALASTGQQIQAVVFPEFSVAAVRGALSELGIGHA
jgi:hypothetical protein